MVTDFNIKEPLLSFIGTGCFSNFKEGCTSAFLEYGKELDKLFIIDIGFDVLPKLVNLGLLCNKTEIRILLTHMHTDHIGGLPAIIDYVNYYLRQGIDVKVYFPHPELVKQLLNLQMVDAEVLHPDELDIDNIVNFKVIKANHGSYDNSYSYAFTLKYGLYEQRVFYSGDSLLQESTINSISNKEYDIVYHDTSDIKYLNIPLREDYPHAFIEDILENVNSTDRNKIYCIHKNEQFREDFAIAEGLNMVHSIELEGLKSKRLILEKYTHNN